MIGLKCRTRVFLAPMEEINDIAFRTLCKRAGAELAWTPMTSPLTKQKQHLEDKPVLQLFGTSPAGIREFVKKYDKEVSGWDFNLGCPAKNAKKRGFGSYLTDLKEIEKILSIMRKNTKKFLCVKIRKSPLTFRILTIAEKLKLDAVCIHPRTQKQGYSGEPDLVFAKEIKKKSTLPIIYSGNVSEKNYKLLLKEFDAVMVGREAIGNPNIFSRIAKTKAKTFTFFDYLKLAQKYKTYFRQIKFQAMNFTKGKKGSRKLRERLSHTKSIEEIKNLMID